MNKKNGRKFFPLPIILAAVLIVLLLVVEYGQSLRLAVRGIDNKPTVDFTWTPIGRVSLKEMIGRVKVEDDYALDFNTLKLEIVELNQTIELTRSDVIGKSFEQEISLAMFDNQPELMTRGQMTIRVSVADDRGQEAILERVVKLKPSVGGVFLNFQ
ncbi:hypothetical protein KKF05_00405 [Patescibacteria group bacterium]|nr:hypothetical protein [Patescibacteria group bacterium]MBU1029322.1 hypothetical protein [Patescibacteria group bacterium]MBU1916066.1 hypothetical protein [Patescibacteria group bacterium]